MTDNERPPRTKPSSATQSLLVAYEELLRLREEVREAEDRLKTLSSVMRRKRRK
jgi:hypothetical protein